MMVEVVEDGENDHHRLVLSVLDRNNNPELTNIRNEWLNELRVDSTTVTLSKNIIGHGGFGDVFGGLWGKRRVAVKIHRHNYHNDGTEQDIRHLAENEILAMKFLGSRNQHILDCHGYSPNLKDGHSFGMILEFAQYGSLSGVLLKNKSVLPHIPPMLIIAWLTDIAGALSHMHSKRIKHQDVKAQNCLLFGDFKVKLCDFGLSKQHLSLTGSKSGMAGTESFWAPEILMGHGSVLATDIFSFGMTAIQIIIRQHPNRQNAHKVSIDHATDVLTRDSDSVRFAKISSSGIIAIGDLLSKCFRFDHREPDSTSMTKWRPTACEVYEFFKTLLMNDGGDPRENSRSDLQHMFRQIKQVHGGWVASDDTIHSAVRKYYADQNLGVSEYGHISTWDTRGVTNMCRLFENMNEFNDDISAWEVENVVNMDFMFYRAINFNQPLESWNISNVTTMKGMFQEARSFNQPLDNWKVNVSVDVTDMFLYATSFLQPLNDWISNNADICNRQLRYKVMQWCNDRASAERKYGPISEWDTSYVTDMSELFKDQKTFNDNIESWNVSNVTTMRGMFSGAMVFNQPLDNWNVSHVTDMSYMFFKAAHFNQPLNNWNVDQVTSMTRMFSYCLFFNRPLCNWNVQSVLNMSSMFAYASSFHQPLNNWNVQNVTDMNTMFAGIPSYDHVLSTWNIENVNDVSYMFYDAINYNQPLGSWDVSQVVDMRYLFCNAIKFNQPLMEWDIGRVEDMSYMFHRAINFRQPILTAWDMSKVANTFCMFGTPIHVAQQQID